MTKRTTGTALSAAISSAEALKYEENSLKELRNAGYRITMPRVQVIRALADTTKALSAYAIHEKIVGGNGKIDVVSVYRILATLQEVGLIHHIGVVDGYFPCRLAHSDPNHSMVVVDEPTGNVKEFDLPPSLLAEFNAQAAANGFTTKTLKIEITGAH